MPEFFLNLPPPDSSIYMQSPPPTTAQISSDTDFEREDAPSEEGPIDFMPEFEGKRERCIVFRPKCMKAPVIIIDSHQ